MPTIKNYKADLKAKHSIYVKLSMAFVLLLLISVFKLSPKASREKIIATSPPDTILVKITPTVQENKPPPPPPKPKPIFSDLDENIVDLILDDIDIFQDAKIGPPPPPPDPPIILDDEPYFDWVPEMPTPIGGIQAIQKLVYYTEIARRAGIKGTVYIEALIDEEGNVINAIVKKGIGGGLDEAALNAVNLTKFYPGKQRGKAVKVKMIIPIKFVLR